jgi:GT2 family glycosyltransferase
MKPIVSICIANYNGIGLIDDCIESVRAQDTQLPFEIIIHDDASTDGSVAHIRAHYPDATLIESMDNVGFCIANNRMAAAAKGEFLLLLNNDAAVMTDALQTLHDEATHLARSAILSLPQYDFDSGELIDRGCMLDPFFNPVPNTDIERQDVAMVIGACLWIPKCLWDDLGGFPEWFESIGEDLYLCCRARLAGLHVRVASSSGYRHHVGRSFGGGKVQGKKLSTTYRRRSLSERNKTFAMLICHPLPVLALLFPVHIVLIHLEGALFAAMRRDKELWRKIYIPLLPSLWSGRHKLKLARTDVQRQRNLSLPEWLGALRWLPWKLRMLLRHGIPEVNH